MIFRWPVVLSLSASAGVLAGLAVTAVVGEPAWATDASLALVGWMALEIIRQGRALKTVPTRPLLDAWKAEAEVEHDETRRALADLKATVADNSARIEGLLDLIKAQAERLDEGEGARRDMATTIQENRLEAVRQVGGAYDKLDERLQPVIRQIGSVYDKLDERLRPIERRQVTRENRDRRKRKGTKRDRGRN